jgi:ribokinase
VTVHFVGRVGDDPLGQQLLQGLHDHNISTRHVAVTPNTPSGIAMILVDHAGENCIAVSSGANAHVSLADIDAAQDLIASAACVVMQLEIPIDTVVHAVQICRRLGIYTILDAAPVPTDGVPAAATRVDLLTANETEAAMLLDLPGFHPEQAPRLLLARGAGSVVVKQGSRGAMATGRGGDPVHVGAFNVAVVDTTAAGDAFTAALAVARAEGMALPEAIRFANAAGALCCTAAGAQPSLPTRDSVNRLLQSQTVL